MSSRFFLFFCWFYILVNHGIVATGSVATPSLGMMAPSINQVTHPPHADYVSLVVPHVSLVVPTMTVSVTSAVRIESPSKDRSLSSTVNQALLLPLLPPRELHSVDIPGNVLVKEVAPVKDTSAIDLDGFFEMKVQKREHSPRTASGTLLTVIQNSYAYKQLPRDVISNSSLRQTQRYDIRVTGRYNDHTSILFHVYKEPDFDMEHSILLTYKTTHLFFGTFTANFNNGAFLTMTRSLEGMYVETQYKDSWEGQLINGKERSKPKKTVFSGNGGTGYSLPNKNILEGSVTVYINNKKVSDYQVKHSEGRIVFDSPKTASQLIKVIYEFTNPVADFLPILQNRKSFRGGEFKWQKQKTDKIYPVIDTMTETFQMPVTTNYDLTFALAKTSLVLGSEVVKRNHVALTSVVDYDIDYADGRLRLKHHKPGAMDQIDVSYQHYQTTMYNETLMANDSKGPYYLMHPVIILGSAQVALNGRVLREKYDYQLDYGAGKLWFAYRVDHPDTIKVTYRIIKIKKVVSDTKTSPFKFGVSYMNEFVRAEDEDENEIKETLTAADNTVRVLRKPIKSLKKVKQNGQDISVDKDDVNLYKGEIKGLTSGQSYTVSYEYEKSVSMRASFSLWHDSGSGVKFDSNDPKFDLPARPVNFETVSRVVVFPSSGSQGGIELNVESYTVGYEDNGDRITLEFHTRNEDGHENSDLTEVLEQNTLVHVYYQTPQSTVSNQHKFDHKTYGVTFGYQPSDKWGINGEFAIAENNFQRAELVGGKNNIEGVPTANHPYGLGKTGIVEDSEVVVVKKAGSDGTIMNRESDYNINYAQGTLQFRNIILNSDEVFDVSYRYYDASAQMAGKTETSQAYKVNGNYRVTPKLGVSGKLMTIDNEFKPVGVLREAKGTRLWGGRIDFTQSPTQTLYSEIERRKLYQPNTNKSSVYRTHEQITVGSQWDFFDGRLRTKLLSERQLEQEPYPASTNKKIDWISHRHEGQVGFGPESFKTKINAQVSDRADAVNKSGTYEHHYDIGSTIQPKKLWWGMHEFRAKPLYSRTYRKNKKTAGISNMRQFEQRKLITFLKPSATTEFHFDSTLDTITTRKDDGRVYLERLSDVVFKGLYTPYYWLKTNAQYKQKTYESPLFGQKGKEEIRQLYQLEELGVYSAIVALNNAALNRWFRFTRKSTLAVDYTLFDTRENNDLHHNNSRDQTYVYRNFSPMTGISLDRIEYRKGESAIDNKVKTGTQQRYHTDNVSDTLSGDLSVKPVWSGLRQFNYTRTFKRHRDQSNTTTQLAPVLPNTTSSHNYVQSQRKERMQTHTLYFTPDNAHIGKVSLGALSATIKWDDTTVLYERENRPAEGNRTLNKDNKVVDKKSYALQFSPFNKVKTAMTWALTEQFLNRNINTSEKGAFQSNDNAIDASFSFHPLKKLDVTSKLNFYDIRQYKATDNHTTKSDIKHSDRYSKRLVQHSGSYTVDATWHWLDWFALTMGTRQLYKTQSRHQPGDASEWSYERFDQLVGNAGLVLTPYPKLEIAYTYSLKKIENFGGKIGQSHRVKVTFLRQKKHYKVDASLSGVYTVGQDFNALDQSILKGGEGIIDSIKVRYRDDVVWDFHINLDVYVPTRIQFVDRFTIVGGGYVSQVDDRVNAGNSYYVGGITVTGRVEF